MGGADHMTGDMETLKRLSTDRVSCPVGFAVPGDVWADVRGWPLGLRVDADRIDRICSHCWQTVIPMSNPQGAYHYTDEEKDGLVLAHLIQAHGWTREGRPDGE